MTFKEFTRWCDDRCYDGYWGMKEALICTNIVKNIRKHHFWKREKVWKELYEEPVVDEIVNPTNELIKQKGLSEKL